MVVPVLITNSQVSLKWKKGPLIAQIKTIAIAIPNAPAVPSNREELFASRLNTLDCLPEDEASSMLLLWLK
ncbi:MAG: hypothetical protein OJF51_002435 [Nitrospira sp.]|nr:MAG: hypothetical protein OJF51_002435 [Nitrospira sp.]